MKRSKMKSLAHAEKPSRGSKKPSVLHLTSSLASHVDRTPKLFIGLNGKQARPDSGYSIPIPAANGAHAGDVGEGQSKRHPQ